MFTSRTKNFFPSSKKKSLSLLEIINQLEFEHNIINKDLQKNIQRITQLIKEKKETININIQNENGNTALIACGFLYEKEMPTEIMTECMRWLIEAGAALEIKNKKEQTALDYIIYNYKMDRYENDIENYYEHAPRKLSLTLKRQRRIPYKIALKKGWRNQIFLDLKHHLSMARILLNANAQWHDSAFIVDANYRSAISLALYNNSTYSQLNMIFLFIKDMIHFLKDKHYLAENVYTSSYLRLEKLMTQLLEQKETNVSPAKSFLTLHKKAQTFFKNLTYPPQLGECKKEITHIVNQSTAFPTVVTDIVIQYVDIPSLLFSLKHPFKINDKKNIPAEQPPATARL